LERRDAQRAFSHPGAFPGPLPAPGRAHAGRGRPQRDLALLGEAKAKPEHAAEIKKRTLTNLYNTQPARLDNAHKALDAAVAAACGWVDYRDNMSEEEILRRLLALNLARSGGGGQESRRSG